LYGLRAEVLDTLWMNFSLPRVNFQSSVAIYWPFKAVCKQVSDDCATQDIADMFAVAVRICKSTLGGMM
jgi:hypothetical protein